MTTELLHNLFDWHPMMRRAFQKKGVLVPAQITANIVEKNKVFFFFFFFLPPRLAMGFSWTSFKKEQEWCRKWNKLPLQFSVVLESLTQTWRELLLRL